MRKNPAQLIAAAVAVGMLTSHTPIQAASQKQPPRYAAVIRAVESMVSNARVQRLAQRQRLHVLNVLWEDTGRYQGSSVGPNISDVTIEVRDGRRTALMPVIRHPNFTDKTADLKLDKIRVPVGNHQTGRALESIGLRELLRNPEQYMSTPGRGRIVSGSLLARRDSHVLVSAQAAFLPVPHAGKATFWPVIFNYQSSRRNPAVLSILVTRQGTSMSIIDNGRDSRPGSWGQRLFFNAAGQRAPLTAERLSDVKARGQTDDGVDASQLGNDANLLMLIQVPLRVRVRAHEPKPAADSMGAAAAPAKRARGASGRQIRDDVETAVLGHGKTTGPFTELAGLRIRRDPRFPIRVTVQLYQATSNGVVSAQTMRALAAQIRKVYRSGDFIGSLVTGTQARPTAWTGSGKPPADLSLQSFPGLLERYRARDQEVLYRMVN